MDWRQKHADKLLSAEDAVKFFNGGKTARQRAEELISVAHPDFRGELRKEAERLYHI